MTHEALPNPENMLEQIQQRTSDIIDQARDGVIAAQYSVTQQGEGLTETVDADLDTNGKLYLLRVTNVDSQKPITYGVCDMDTNFGLGGSGVMLSWKDGDPQPKGEQQRGALPRVAFEPDEAELAKVIPYINDRFFPTDSRGVAPRPFLAERTVSVDELLEPNATLGEQAVGALVATLHMQTVARLDLLVEKYPAFRERVEQLKAESVDPETGIVDRQVLRRMNRLSARLAARQSGHLGTGGYPFETKRFFGRNDI